MYDMKNLVYVLTMLECIEKIWIYTQEFTEPNEFIWANEQKEFNATLSLFIAIGEESKKIEATLKEDSLSDLSWKDIAGLRDKISHDYRGTNADILWAVIHKDLKKLKKTLIIMVDKINPPQELLEEFLSTPYYQHMEYLK